MRLTPLTLVLMTICIGGLAGCGSTSSITPDVRGAGDPSLRVPARVEYDGNPEYLPPVLVRVDAAALVARYRHDADYGVGPIPQNAYLLGIGDDRVKVTGALTFLRGEQVIKSYTATCTILRGRNAFSGGATLTELRRRALLAVRDNIDAQVRLDRDLPTAASAQR